MQQLVWPFWQISFTLCKHTMTHTHTHGAGEFPDFPSCSHMLACSSLSVTKPSLWTKRNSSGCICTAGMAEPIPARLWWQPHRSDGWEETLIWGAVAENTPQAGLNHRHFLLYKYTTQKMTVFASVEFVSLLWILNPYQAAEKKQGPWK